MTELPQDFCDLLVELADSGAEFVLLGGHAVASWPAFDSIKAAGASVAVRH